MGEIPKVLTLSCPYVLAAVRSRARGGLSRAYLNVFDRMPDFRAPQGLTNHANEWRVQGPAIRYDLASITIGI